MSTKILIIDNYDSFTYNLIQLVEELNCKYDIIKNDRIDFDLAAGYKKILITPGPGIPSEAGNILQFIKHFSKTKSILGVCLGCQAIAEVFGGRLKQLPNVSHGICKEIKILDEQDYIFNGLPKMFEAGLYHSWAVSADGFPKELKITAKTIDGTIMVFTHREYDVKGIQFHPESIMTHYGKKIIENWLAK
jgi:anthranilate synthase component 2